MGSVGINDLPKKGLNLIFRNFSQLELQKLRLVCSYWKNFIAEEYPVNIVITQNNYERLFLCPVAVAVEIKNLVSEYNGHVGFGPVVRSIQFTGKVLSSNIFSILRYCPGLETLCFSSLKQALGIESVESLKLPRTTLLEIKVRPDQETFTSDEIIIIGVLRQILFGSLDTVLITAENRMDFWEVDDDDYDQQPEGYNGESASFSVSALSPISSAGGLSPSEATHFSPSLLPSEAEVGEPDPDATLNVDSAADGLMNLEGAITISHIEEPQLAITSQTEGTQTTQPNLDNFHVIVNRGLNFTNGSDSSAREQGTTSETATTASNASSLASRRLRRNISDFEARLLYANLELLMERSRESDTINILNGSRSHTGPTESSVYFDLPGTNARGTNHPVFFEFVRNNHATLKNLYVKTRADFMCFGNLSSFARDLSKVQFEEVEYSFGRTQMCCEHGLLQSQCQLRKIRLHILDDMWKSLMIAVENSRNTISDLDVKVMSVNDERVDIIPITKCYNLKSLKLLHFFEKESLCRLPQSLNKLILNGPISYKDMDAWTRGLSELEDFTLLLNIRGDKIDLPLFKKFLKMPKTNRLTFIQCPMDLNDIRKYIDGKLSQTGLKFWVNGPKELADLPSVQYVYTLIRPEFNREQIEI